MGPVILDNLFQTMMIDSEWSRREDRSFTWWPHRLAQRVWAEPVADSGGYMVSVVHAQTDLLKNVPDTIQTLARLSTLNQFADMNAFVFDQSTGRVALHSAAGFHPENGWLFGPFSMGVAFQQSTAHVFSEYVAELLGGEPDHSAHPDAGPRSTPDHMVSARLHLPESESVVPFVGEDFKWVADFDPPPWVLANSGDHGLTIEFPFISNVPSFAATKDNPPGTAMLIVREWDSEAEADQPDPETALGRMLAQLRKAPAKDTVGNGMVMKLGLPISPSPEEAFVMANHLNAREAESGLRHHAIGAWFGESGAVWFTRYFPTAIFAPLEQDQRRIVLLNFVFDMAIRSRWAREILIESPGN